MRSGKQSIYPAKVHSASSTVTTCRAINPDVRAVWDSYRPITGADHRWDAKLTSYDRSVTEGPPDVYHHGDGELH